MKKNKIIVLGLCALMLCGCGKEIPSLSDGSQAVVTFNDENIHVSADELYNKMKEQYALDTMIQLMDLQILEKELPDEIENAKEEAKNTVESMKDTYGEDQINAYFGSVSSYENYIYLNNLQNKAMLNYAKTKVNDKEIKAYYDKNIYGDVTVRHILIQTGVTDDTSSDEKEKLENEAKDKINEIIAKLDKAENKLETFEQLVKEYSQDDATKDNNGSLGAINTGSLSSSYDEVLKAARNLKDGEYSKELITTELGYHVIYRESSSEKKPLEEVEDEIKNTLGEEKLNDDSTLSITAMQELRKKYGMDIKDSDIKEKYQNYIANSIASARESDANKTTEE